MKKAQKAQSINQIEKVFAKATIGILTDYRGLKTPEVNGLRRKLQDNNGDYKVVKNTLAAKAAEKVNHKEIVSSLRGPVAVAVCYGDGQVTARVLTEYVRTSKINLPIKGGFMGNALLSSDDVTTLATLPPRPMLVARVVGGFKGPLYALVGVLSAPMRDLQGVLQARIKQLEGSK